MTDGFLSKLGQVRQSYQSQKAQLDTLVKASENELAQISSTIRALEQQQLETNRRIYQARQAEIQL